MIKVNCPVIFILCIMNLKMGSLNMDEILTDRIENFHIALLLATQHRIHGPSVIWVREIL